MFKNCIEDGVVTNFEYDPNRSSYIAKICYLKNKKKYYYYLLAPKNLSVLDNIQTDNTSVTKNLGNRYYLKDFNIGDFIYNIELKPNKGGQLVRSAGTYGQILQKTKDNYVLVKLPSGEHRLIPNNCKASLGVVSNEEHKHRIIKKAGQSR
jgi:large subunit ribosomal protein L2